MPDYKHQSASGGNGDQVEHGAARVRAELLRNMWDEVASPSGRGTLYPRCRAKRASELDVGGRYSSESARDQYTGDVELKQCALERAGGRAEKGGEAHQPHSNPQLSSACYIVAKRFTWLQAMLLNPSAANDRINPMYLGK